jgi:DnaJ-domain-containing protein 1
VDLSSTGLRLRSEAKPKLSVGQVLPVTLQSPQARLTLHCRVVRICKKGFRAKSFDIGLEFVDIQPQIAKALEQMALFGFVPRSDQVRGAVPPAAKSNEPLPDHYAVLGLTAGATAQQVHDSYRALARQFHPDSNKSPDAAAQFDAVSKAYRVLRDPELREGYDIQRSMAT